MKSRADRRWHELSAGLRENRGVIPLRMAVLAAHPDDESIGASSVLPRCDDPAMIYLTDGAPRDPKLWSPDFQGSRQQYLSLRRKETEQALALAEVSPGRTYWLGAVDQESVFQVEDLALRLFELLARMPVDVLITHSYEGGHPDHDTAALVARLVVDRSRSESAPLLAEMTSYHARHGQCVNGEFLNGDAAQEVRMDLTVAERARKAAMFRAHASQRRVLQTFSTHQERFRCAPEYDFSRPSHEGKLWYECMGWPISGEQWRAQAKAKIAALREAPCR